MDKFLNTIKTKYSTSSHDQKQYPPRYSSEPVKLELVVKNKPTSTCPDAQLLPYSDIFKKEKERVVRKVLIEGGAGIGKTTFCLSISKDWANEKLFQEFKMLLLLPLHEKRIAATRSLADLTEILQGVKDLTASIADSIEKTNGEGILLVVDGWDELHAPECSKSFLCNLLFGRIFELASIIVTSRPSHSEWLCKNGCFDRLLTIRGFDDRSIRQYIQVDFTENQQESDRLLETVDSNPLIKSMCHIPLNCATLCHLWHTESRKRKFSTTMTELCTKMILNVVLHSIKKVDKYESISHLPSVESLPEELRSSWWNLCRLAFQTVQKSQQINLSQFKSDTLIMIGLVEIVSEAKCNFLHPVIQEYLAALHVANQYHSPDTRLQDQWIRSLGKHVTDFWRFLFGICGQSRSNLALLERAIQSLSKFDHLRCLICHCAFEAKNSMIDKRAIKALNTQSDSKHFGDPQSTHDCEAILYVIKQVRNLESDAKLELNFKNCIFKKQQLRDLTKILTQGSKIEVKSLDLSNKVNLPNKKVADLFNKANEALTAFQTLEKLSLRNNKIGKKIGEASYTMEALCFLKCLTQLDLSFNRLTLPGLEALQDTVKSGSLAQLEILLLQASLTCDANENIHFLKTFSPSLSSHCHKLQELDISRNDLGESGSPFISAVICTLTRSGLNLHVDKQYESEVDKNFLKTMEDLVRREEEIGHTVVHGVIVGPGRSGKNSLVDRLMGKGPLDQGSISPSTGVLDSVVKVEVKKLCTMDAATASLKWTKLEYDQEALELMMITVITHIASLADEERKLEPLPDLITRLDKPVKIESAAILVEKTESKNKNESDGENRNESESENKIDNHQEEITVPEIGKGALIHPQNEAHVSSGMPKISYSKEFSLREGPMDIFKHAVKLRRMRALREHLESKWSLYLTNTGGQLEFQELMPLLVCGPSVFFVTIPLHINLHMPYTVRYQYPDGTEKTYLSSSTLMEEILQTLATIAALDCTGPQSEEVDHNIMPIKPKVFFIGTHKDKLPESSADNKIQEIDKQLQDIVKQTSLKQDSIQYAESSDQLMFTVNNLDEGDFDFQKIRSAVQGMVERQKEFTIPCPCSWLVFSLVLRAKHKSSRVLSYYECLTVAQSCGISNKDDFHKALLFIHHRLGLIRYFPVKGLNDRVIIDLHLMFDTITKLIVETFISDHASEREIEDLQKRGIFSKEAMRIISLKNYSDSQLPFEWTLELLKHLGIAISFKDQNGEERYFFSSVLCHAPNEKQGSNVSSCSIKAPPPILIAFKGGFCPRAIPGTLIKSLMDTDTWKLNHKKIFRNQVSFSVGVARIILKILPTHIEVYCFSPGSGTADHDRNLRDRFTVTCEEVYKQIKRIMSDITVKFRDSDYYHFAFNCTHSECKKHPHPAKIDWDANILYCRRTGEGSHLPDGYKLWTDSQQVLGDQVLDSNNDGVSLHLGRIADNMCEWKGSIADHLGLTPADVAAINIKHPNDLKLQTREALERWKQKFGSGATYNNLIKVFEQTGYRSYAEIIKDLVMKNVQIDTIIDQTPPPPSKQPLPVFPSESECKQFLESPLYAAAPRVKLLQEDYQLGRNPGSNPRIKVEKSPCDDDRSSQSQSNESDEDSYIEEEDDKLSEQSETESVTSMQDSTDLHIESGSSTMESVQERWLNSDPARQNVLKQQSIVNDTEAQSESKLEKEALSDNKPSGSMQGEDTSLKQSKLEHEVPSDNKPSGSVEREDTLLKQTKLEDVHVARSDNKLSGSMEREDDSLKQSNLEVGGPTARKKWHSTGLQISVNQPNISEAEMITRVSEELEVLKEPISREEAACSKIQEALNHSVGLQPGVDMDQLWSDLGVASDAIHVPSDRLIKIYHDYMGSVEQECLANLEELLLERHDIFDPNISEEEMITRVLEELKDHECYKRLDKRPSIRHSQILKHLGGLQLPERSIYGKSHLADNLRSLLAEGTLNRWKLKPPDFVPKAEDSLKWVLDPKDQLFNLSILARTQDNAITLRSDFMNHLSGGGTCQVDDRTYQLEMRLFIGEDIETMTNESFSPQGAVAVVNTMECLGWLEKVLERLWIPHSDTMPPYRGMPLIILALDESAESDIKPDSPQSPLHQGAKRLANMVQCVCMMERPTPQPKRLVVTTVIHQLILSLMNGVAHINEYLNSELRLNNPRGLNIAVCTLRDDPYPVESLLSPWLAHQLVSVYEGGDATAALFHRSAIDKQHRTCTLTFHSALNLKDILSFVRLGIILVYSTQRPASLAVAKALLPKLPNLPKLIVAMAMDGSHDNKLLEEGQSLANETNAVFVYNNGKALPMTFCSDFLYKCWFSRFTSYNAQEIPEEIRPSFLTTEPVLLPAPPSSLSRSIADFLDKALDSNALIDGPMQGGTLPRPPSRSKVTKAAPTDDDDGAYSDPIELLKGMKQKKQATLERQRLSKVASTPAATFFSPQHHTLRYSSNTPEKLDSKKTALYSVPDRKSKKPPPPIAPKPRRRQMPSPQGQASPSSLSKYRTRLFDTDRSLGGHSLLPDMEVRSSRSMSTGGRRAKTSLTSPEPYDDRTSSLLKYFRGPMSRSNGRRAPPLVPMRRQSDEGDEEAPPLPERRCSQSEMGLEEELPPLPARNYSWSDMEDNDDELFQSDNDF